MKYAVRYYTKTGNTKRLAEAIAKELGVEALPVSETVNEKVDILFLGNSYYAFTIDPEVRAFIRSLDKNKIGRIVTLLSEMLNVSSERALDIFYTSKTCEQLHDPSTLLYTFSDGYIVDDVLLEIQK